MTVSSSHAEEIAAGARFRFGENWARFLRTLDEKRIDLAVESLRDLLQVEDLHGKRFLDIGSGSGLFSLAARRLGATVHSFDFDPQSEACTLELRRRFYPADLQWRIERGSVLDASYMASLGRFDVVYSWGVLHHTGDLLGALALAGQAVASGGLLFIAIYNHQGFITRYWTWVKRVFNASTPGRTLMVLLHLPYLLLARWLVRRLTGRRPIERGMSMWHDMIDWLGGYPFETAKPETVFRFFRDRGFRLQELRTCGGRMGCNEFVLRRVGTAG